MGKVYATSDWHGCSAPAKKLINYLNEDDKLFYLGDSIDRGEDGFELFKLLIEDPRVIYIKGNHDDMMMRGLLDANRGSFGHDYKIWMMNGGQSTFNAIKPEDVDWVVNKIKTMPEIYEYNSPKGHKVYLEHAGFSLGKQNQFHDPLWDREHFFDKWSYSPEDQDTYIVHGHTPVQYLQFHYGYIDAPSMTETDLALRYAWTDNPGDWRPQIIRYCDGHKFDIDLCTIVSDRVVLLDLDTFDVKYFEGDEDE